MSVLECIPTWWQHQIWLVVLGFPSAQRAFHFDGSTAHASRHSGTPETQEAFTSSAGFTVFTARNFLDSITWDFFRSPDGHSFFRTDLAHVLIGLLALFRNFVPTQSANFPTSSATIIFIINGNCNGNCNACSIGETLSRKRKLGSVDLAEIKKATYRKARNEQKRPHWYFYQLKGLVPYWPWVVNSYWPRWQHFQEPRIGCWHCWNSYWIVENLMTNQVK